MDFFDLLEVFIRPLASWFISKKQINSDLTVDKNYFTLVRGRVGIIRRSADFKKWRHSRIWIKGTKMEENWTRITDQSWFSHHEAEWK